MRNRTYGGVRGRKTKVGRKLLRFPPTRFRRNAKNGKILPFEVEQKVEIKGGAKISTELEPFSLICNVLRIKKTWLVSYFCPN